VSFRNGNKALDMVTADQRQIITEVAEQLGNSFGSCQAQDGQQSMSHSF